MSLLKAVDSDYITAYKAKDNTKVSVLRLLKTAFKNKQVDLGRALTDDEALQIVVKEVKQRQDSAEQYQKAGRNDLAEIEIAEEQVLQQYLPAQLDGAELEALVDATIASQGATTMKDMGRVMNAIMDAHKGSVDGKTLSGLVRSRLS